MNRKNTDPRGLTRISQLSGYTVSDEDPDIRGWKVVGANGEVIGKVDDLFVDTAQMKVREVEVDLDGADNVTLPAEQLEVDSARRQVHLHGSAGDTPGRDREYRGSEGHIGAADRNRDRLTRSEEELRIGTERVQEGEVVVGKHVETERVQEPVTLRREEVVIERRPVSGDEAADPQTLGSAEIRVPLTREEAVVEKRPVVKEEIVIGKRVVEEQETVEADLRREEFDITDPTRATDRSRRRE